MIMISPITSLIHGGTLLYLVGKLSATTAAAQYMLDGVSLPHNWVYGCATSAYQVEGAWNEDGKGVSVWDTYVHDKGKGHVGNDETGDVAIDFYHRYKTDLPLIKSALGAGVYDFTIAWTRILPNGTGHVPSKAGVEFYRNIIKASNKAGMDNFCTLYHWDLPQTLQDKYHGWVSHNVVEDFKNYAKVVFDALGDVCQNWVTMNEPRTFCTEGYGPNADFAPGLVGPFSDTYDCMHNALLAHASAVDVFRKGGYKGRIGIKIDGTPAVPLDPTSKKDQDAVVRSNDFEMGWDVAPLYTGDYPPIMRKVMGRHLPNFTSAESALLKGSADFLGFDAYTSQWVTPTEGSCEFGDDTWPNCIDSYQEKDDTNELIGRPTQSEWNFLYNSTVYDGLKYLHTRWGAGPLIVSENGLGIRNDTQLPLAQIVDDIERIDWYRSTFRNLQWALDDGIPLQGFVPWSCLSNFEWTDGYENDFGIIKVQLPDQIRTPKKSSAYLKGVMTKGKRIDPFDFDDHVGGLF